MPTARELLEQADALMRRNRSREPEPGIPELTDEVAVAESVEPPQRSAKASTPPPRAFVRADDVPELTDAVASIEEVSIESLPDEGEMSRWLEVEMGEASITGPAPDSIAVVPPSTLRPPPASGMEVPPAQAFGFSDEHKLSPATAAAVLAGTAAAAAPASPSDPAFDAMLGLPPAEADFEHEIAPPSAPPPEEARAPESALDSLVVPPAEIPAAENAPAAGPVSWEAVAEEIRMQVLQRIDIFTDTGLQGELAARLQPVVDRASADLVVTINREVGQLLRAYVAEAIEREIEKWRQANP